MILRAPAKVNLALYLGPPRPDGLHELCSLTQSLELSDRLTVREASRDEVSCPGIEGPNLVERAIGELRGRGWARAPVRVEIEKRIPVAAGLGGGSSDAAAVLRLAREQVEGIERLAAELGADVPAQLEPGQALVRGAGELVEALPPPPRYGIVLVPSPRGLLTADVYAEADRLGLGRDPAELEALAERLREAAGGGEPPLALGELVANDLQQAALSLHPEIAEPLAALERHGAARALVSGSGPTAFGIFASVADAERGASALRERHPSTIVTAPSPAR